MQNQKFLLFFCLISITGFSQISFEKGYFIDNSGQKTECFIKNMDWKNNPTGFEYKNSNSSEVIKTEINSIKEFSITNSCKYIRKTIKIDKSNDNINNLSRIKTPEFVEETAFLKVLVESQVSLYQYENNSILKFFYNKNNSDNVEQLVHKIFLSPENEIGTNSHYKQQLWNDLKCETIDISRIEQLEYKKNKLIKFFIDYNECNNLNYKKFEANQKKDLFHLSIRTHLKNSNLKVENYIGSTPPINYGNKLGLASGIELEYIFSFNKNKWAILIEPTYQNYKSENTSEVNFVSGGKVISTVKYSSIEVPISFRHYLFLNESCKLFINASYLFDLSLNSSIDFRRADNSNLYTLDINPRRNLGLGIGYKFRDKYSLEMRTQFSRNLIGDYIFWDSNYTSFSFIAGYTLF